MSDETELPPVKLEGAATAPIIMFDEVPIFGVMPGMGRVTLSTIVQDDDGRGGIIQRRVVVAQLRGNAIAFDALRHAINGMEIMAAPAQGGEKPN